MTSSALAFSLSRGSWRQYQLVERYAPIVTIVLALIAIWYIASVLMNLSLVRDGFEREETPYTIADLIEGTMKLLAAARVDYTIFWHRLSRHVAGAGGDPVRDLFLDREAFDRWLSRYEERLGPDRDQAGRCMRRVNPKYVLRNHLCEIAIRQARQKDFSGIEAMLAIVQSPFDEHPGHEDKAGFPPEWAQHIEISCSS